MIYMNLCQQEGAIPGAAFIDRENGQHRNGGLSFTTTKKRIYPVELRSHQLGPQSKIQELPPTISTL